MPRAEQILNRTLSWAWLCPAAGLEVEADKTKDIVISRDQKAWWSHNMKLIVVPL